MSGISRWWDSRTKHVHGNVVMAASETQFLWGFLKVHRYRAYLVDDIDAVKLETPYRTWRSFTVGAFTFSFRLPRFVEDRVE